MTPHRDFTKYCEMHTSRAKSWAAELKEVDPQIIDNVDFLKRAWRKEHNEICEWWEDMAARNLGAGVDRAC
jgi:hypothetical protein